MCFSVSQRESCPQFESPEPLLIPVGYKTPISFHGRNLDIYTVRSAAVASSLLTSSSCHVTPHLSFRVQDKRFTIGTELMKRSEEEVTQEQGSKFTFSGYEVSGSDLFLLVGRRKNATVDLSLHQMVLKCSLPGAAMVCRDSGEIWSREEVEKSQYVSQCSGNIVL